MCKGADNIRSRCGFPKCVDLLMKTGADVNIVNNRNNTPLMEAATWDHLECV